MNYFAWAISALGAAFLGYVIFKNLGLFDREGRGWSAGPIINGKNRSDATVRDNICTFGEIHYLTRAAKGPLSGKWIIEFEVQGDGFFPPERPDAVCYVSAYFQRKGDNWSSDLDHRAHRWYSATPYVMEAGHFRLELDFENPMSWTPMMSGGNGTFAEAKADPDRIGLVFGHSSGRGHGVRGSGAIIILNERFERLL